MKHTVWRGAVAMAATAATLMSLAGVANAADGKSAQELAAHGGAQRIATIGSKTAKNVILFIGDGMGDSEITVARDYLHGANGTFDGLDKIGQPSALGDVAAGTGQYTTFSLGEGIGDKGNPKVTPVTDSAASGSAWATGTKTYNGAISVDAYGNAQMSLLELAKIAGKATGNVSTAEIQDATPAVQAAHSTERSCYGPQGKTDGTSDNASSQCEASQLKQNGGIGSISEQILDTRADVTLGGGNKYFKQTVQGGEYQGMTVQQQAEAMGYTYITDPADLAGVTEANQDKPLIGLFSSGNMPTRFSPSVATKQDPAKDEHPITCSTNPDWLGNQGVSLADMTKKSIDLLQSNPNGAKNGFFLQVEGASIDKQDHNGNACGQIGETGDLDEAVATALQNVDLSDTLIIVTADHAHTSQIVESQPYYALSTVLQSPVDGAKITVSYGTSSGNLYGDGNDAEGTADASKAQGSMSHTGTQLRIAASGPGAQRVIGLTDQTDNFFTIAQALGLAATTDQQKALSNDAKLDVTQDAGKATAELNGFNGDSVVSYTLEDQTARSTQTVGVAKDGVSGVRVKTAQTTSIDLGDVQEGHQYKLTVTGRQSGKVMEASFAGAAAQASDKTPGKDGGEKSAKSPVAGGENAGLKRTGAAALWSVMVAAALACTGLAARTVMSARSRRR